MILLLPPPWLRQMGDVPPPPASESYEREVSDSTESLKDDNYYLLFMTQQISMLIALLIFGVVPAVDICLLLDYDVSDGREQTTKGKIEFVIGLLMMIIPLIVNIVICAIK